MENLRMNYEETREVSVEMREKNESFKTLLGKIRATNNALTGYWKGADADKYTTAVEEKAKEMDELAEAIEELSDFIAKAANIIEETQTGNAGSININ